MLYMKYICNIWIYVDVFGGIVLRWKLIDFDWLLFNVMCFVVLIRNFVVFVVVNLNVCFVVFVLEIWIFMDVFLLYIRVFVKIKI